MFPNRFNAEAVFERSDRDVGKALAYIRAGIVKQPLFLRKSARGGAWTLRKKFCTSEGGLPTERGFGQRSFKAAFLRSDPMPAPYRYSGGYFSKKEINNETENAIFT